MWADTNDPDHLAAAAEGISASSKVGTFGVHDAHGVDGYRNVGEIVDDLAAEFCPYSMRTTPIPVASYGDLDKAHERKRRAFFGALARKGWLTRRRRQEAA